MRLHWHRRSIASSQFSLRWIRRMTICYLYRNRTTCASSQEPSTSLVDDKGGQAGG